MKHHQWLKKKHLSVSELMIFKPSCAVKACSPFRTGRWTQAGHSRVPRVICACVFREGKQTFSQISKEKNVGKQIYGRKWCIVQFFCGPNELKKERFALIYGCRVLRLMLADCKVGTPWQEGVVGENPPQASRRQSRSCGLPQPLSHTAG